ncbi:MAG: hypothetical protein WBL63_20290 [Candidatus Acidiferrum sp.]
MVVSFAVSFSFFFPHPIVAVILGHLSLSPFSYASQCPNKGFPASTANLGPGVEDCSHANLVDGSLSQPSSVKSGYVFIYQPRGTDDQGHITGYAISADPLQPGVSGNRHFYSDESGIIRFENSSGATSDSPPLT